MLPARRLQALGENPGLTLVLCMDSVQHQELAAVFANYSPRLRSRPIRLRSRMMSWLGVLLFAVLIDQSGTRTGVGAWAVGLAYVAYDTLLLAFTARNILELRRPLKVASQDQTAQPALTLGVIIAAYNEADVLKATIDSLLYQENAPDSILLADDGSDDAISEVLLSHYGLIRPELGHQSAPAPNHPSLRWLRLPRGGKARALNTAMLQLDTELVVTVDADTLLSPGALSAMRHAFTREPNLVAATGVLEPVCGRSLGSRVFQWFQQYEYARNFLSRYAWMGQDSLLLVSGAFAAYRRQAVLDVGGFDPHSLVEDYELTHRLYRRSHDHGLGWTVRVIGEAVARTDAPANSLAFIRQRRRWFGGFLQTQFLNQDMVLNPAYGRLGMRMLVVKALDTLQPVYGLSAFMILVWLMASGRFNWVAPILTVMLVKVALDLSFHLWSLRLYARWVGRRHPMDWKAALLASFLEPFTFQLLRHVGACWGWIAFLSRSGRWDRQIRTSLVSLPSAPPAQL